MANGPHFPRGYLDGDPAERVPVITYANWRHRCTGFVAFWPEPFLEVDGSGVVIEWNPRAEEVFGWMRHEVVGRPVSDRLPRAAPGRID
jgi:PAS domain-containing protein